MSGSPPDGDGLEEIPSVPAFNYPQPGVEELFIIFLGFLFSYSTFRVFHVD